MALRFAVKKSQIFKGVKSRYVYPLSAIVNNLMCRYKSSDDAPWEGSEGSGKFRSLSYDNESTAQNFDAESSLDDYDSSDFSSFAERYSDSLENSNDPEYSNIQVVSVGEVLKNLRKDEFFHKSKMYSKKDKNSSHGRNISLNKYVAKKEASKNFPRKQSNDRQLIEKQELGNLKNLKFSPKYASNKVGPHKKKIILLNNKSRSFSQQSHVKFINQQFDQSQKNIVISNSLAENYENIKSSRNVNSIFEDDHIESVSEKLNSFDIESIRKNCLGIQMLSPYLYHQLFSRIPPKASREQEEDFACSKLHLEDQQLWGLEPGMVPNVDFSLPPLEGHSLEEHFYSIAEEQCAPYKMLLNKLIGGDIPSFPSNWQYTPGWTKYNSDGTFEPVSYPGCQALVFDVELCVREGSHPVLATAVSDKHWYSWCSKQLISDCNVNEIGVEDLIPLESSAGSNEKGVGEGQSQVPQIVVGHNVSFDRLRVSEQYQLKSSALKFVDTMSLHIAVSGLVSEQRALMMKNKSSETKIRLPWMNVGCQNNLNDVYKFYCRVKEDLKKDTRDVFVKGSLQDVRNDFQNLVGYCANDVRATLLVLKKLLPWFYERFPHPVTFSGMLEMGSTFLPVTENWSKYIGAAEKKYGNLERLMNEELVKQAQEALAFKENNKYKKDPWLWNLDWSVPKGRVKTLQGYPNWYRKLCAHTGDREGTPEPENMSTSLQVVPKLLRLTWDGFPLHYERKYGWGYLKPLYEKVSDIPSFESASNMEEDPTSLDPGEVKFPVDVLYEICPCSGKKVSLDELVQDRQNKRLESPETEEDWLLLLSGEEQSDKGEKKRKRDNASRGNKPEVSYDLGIPGVCFVPLPHKDGPGNRVGNPLAKDFLNKIEDNTLSSYHGDIAEVVLKTNKMLSYWKNNRDRIMSQLVIWNDQQDSQHTSTDFSDDNDKTGIILPMVVSAGTITRRAVEPTWMTASNAYEDRIGSELKAMVEAPPGYKFVGADVDSQELWIAAALGDAYFSSEHGATALGWMTLQGKKSDGSDMHSRTANMAGISRDHAKVINYGRIYGAGVKFIQRLLKQFNHSLSEEEAYNRARSLFEATKGKKGWILNDKGVELALEVDYSNNGDILSRKEVYRLIKIAEKHGIETSFSEIVDGSPVWMGGSESHMFNCLEAIARSETPKTPVLGARITRALEPKFVDDQFMTSRVNWVVQSSAVDYLHLMLVSMKWLFKKYDISGRFCISIHDEVRYLVTEEDCHRAALALQITNLLTRSLFAIKLGFKDLPFSVAFFSSVDIDQVLRKEPSHDCVTPSNPKGLREGYGIPPGQSLDIEKILQITKGNFEKAKNS